MSAVTYDVFENEILTIKKNRILTGIDFCSRTKTDITLYFGSWVSHSDSGSVIEQDVSIQIFNPKFIELDTQFEKSCLDFDNLDDYDNKFQDCLVGVFLDKLLKLVQYKPLTDYYDFNGTHDCFCFEKSSLSFTGCHAMVLKVD